MNCPKCGGKGEIKGTVNGVQHRKCRECGHNFRTKKQLEVVQRGDEIKDLLTDFGVTVRPETLTRLKLESSVETITDYLRNQGWIIQNYESLKNESVVDHTAFMMNAILTRQPIPPHPLNNGYHANGNGHYTNGNGNHAEVLTFAPPVAVAKDEAAELWAEILGRLRLQMTEATLSHFSGSKGLAVVGRLLIVQVRTKESREMLEERLNETIQREADGLEIRFIV